MDGELIETTVSNLHWENNTFKLFIGCTETDCCISNITFERNWEHYPGRTVDVEKGNVYLSPVNINCVGRCVVDCNDAPYHFVNTIIKKSSLQTSDIKIKITPLPNNGDFVVNIPDNSFGTYKYTINDNLGQTVLSGTFAIGNNPINASNLLNSGHYTLVIECPNNQILSKQLIISK